MITLDGSDLHQGREEIEAEQSTGFIEFQMPKELFLNNAPAEFEAFLKHTGGGVHPNFSWRLTCRARFIN